MVSVFDFKDYREFLRAWLDQQSGRGASSRLAETMGISPSMMSLIMKADKNLTSEQGMELVEYLALNELESDYFFVLLEIGRSGTHKLSQRLEKKREQLLKQARKITNRVKKDMELTEEQKSVFYSSWLYTGVRNITACPDFQDLHKISEYLKVPYETLQPIVDFLVENNLCKLEKGQLSYGPQHTHQSFESPYANQQHRNWRIKSSEVMEYRRESDLFYTCPMSLSEEAFDQIRKLLPTMIQQVLKISGPSPSEKVACFNIDFFKY